MNEKTTLLFSAWEVAVLLVINYASGMVLKMPSSWLFEPFVLWHVTLWPLNPICMTQAEHRACSLLNQKKMSRQKSFLQCWWKPAKIQPSPGVQERENVLGIPIANHVSCSLRKTPICSAFIVNFEELRFNSCLHFCVLLKAPCVFYFLLLILFSSFY